MREWIKCSDQMPPEMDDVIVTDGGDIKMMWWNGKQWDSWVRRHDIDSDMVTHWMPLPEPPKE